MEDKLELLSARHTQAIPWLSGRKQHDERFVATERRLISSPAMPPALNACPSLIAQPGQRGVVLDLPPVAADFSGVASPIASRLDALTGLPNLTQVSGLIGRLIAEAETSRQALAVVSFDLDAFQWLCEEYGRAIADDILKSAASFMVTMACPHAVVVRHGEHGFTVVLAGLSSAAESAICVQQVLDAIAAPREFGKNTLRIAASAGVAMFPKDGENLDTLSRNARGAMRESKVTCPGALRFYSGNVGTVARRRLRLESDLRRAIQNNELTLFYQPQFEIATGRACGVEVLTRWFRGNSVVEPSVFIPLAEQTQLIATLGSWVLHEACVTAQAWRTRGKKPMTLCVNVSPHQLDEAFPNVIQNVLDVTGFPPERLELEITESALIGSADFVIDCFYQLKAIGVRIAIDDFGKGYSSLSYLSRLPVDRLKLDKSLIHNLTTQWKDVAILRAIIALGHELAIEVIAEGVETEQQLQVLKQLGCRQAQGYLLARPAPHSEAHAMLAKRWGSRPARRRPAIGMIPRTRNAP
jgi:diguanylate cyclase (GGDEF)-like protein